jgi:hypothetical protein
MSTQDFANALAGRTIINTVFTDARVNEFDLYLDDGTIVKVTHSGDDMSYIDLVVAAPGLPEVNVI